MATPGGHAPVLFHSSLDFISRGALWPPAVSRAESRPPSCPVAACSLQFCGRSPRTAVQPHPQPCTFHVLFRLTRSIFHPPCPCTSVPLSAQVLCWAPARSADSFSPHLTSPPWRRTLFSHSDPHSHPAPCPHTQHPILHVLCVSWAAAFFVRTFSTDASWWGLPAPQSFCWPVWL